MPRQPDPIQASGSANVPTAESTASDAAASISFSNTIPFSYFIYQTPGGAYNAKSKDGSVVYTNNNDMGTLLQNVHDNLTGPAVLYIAPGIYNFLTKLSVTKSSVSLMGAGPGITTLTADASLTGNFTILDIEGKVTGTERALTQSTAKGDTQLIMASGDAASFTSGAYLLLKSTTIKDTELGALAGEIQRVNGFSGQAVGLRDQVADIYTTAASGVAVQLSMLQGFGLSNMSIQAQAASGANNQGFVFMRFCQGFAVNNVEISNCNWAALQMSSCLNGNINGCYMHDIYDTVPSTPAHYGVVVHAASKNIVINSCQFTSTRHSVTMGGQTGNNFNGVVRNVTVTNNTSESSDTAHYDTHQACEGIVFSSNTAYGGVGASGNAGVYGFQVRSPRTEVIGNTMLELKTKGVYVFGQGAGTTIIGNQINRVIQASGAGGDGVYLDSGMTQVLVSDNKMQDLDGHVVTGVGGNHNTVIQNNIFINPTVQTIDGAIRLAANNCIVNNNLFVSGSNRPIQIQSGCANWTITNNDFTSMSNTAPALSGGGHILFNNQGYASGIVFSGQLVLQSTSGASINFTSFVSGMNATTQGATSGLFSPAGFVFINISGSTAVKVPYFNS